MPVGLWREPEVCVLRPQGGCGCVPPPADLAPPRPQGPGASWGAGRCPYPQRQGRVARHIFLCAPTRDVTHASLPHNCATALGAHWQIFLHLYPYAYPKRPQSKAC